MRSTWRSRALQPPARRLLSPGGGGPLYATRSARPCRRFTELLANRELARGKARRSRLDRVRSAQAPQRDQRRDVAASLRRWRASAKIRMCAASPSGRRQPRHFRPAPTSPSSTNRARSEAVGEYDDLLDRVLHSIQGSLKPSVAVIYGYCLGGGLEIALACDLRYCAASAQFGIPAAKLGLAYNVEGHKRLLETVGHARARKSCSSAGATTPRRRSPWESCTRFCRPNLPRAS